MKKYSIKSCKKTTLDVDFETLYGKAWAEITSNEAGLFLPGWRRPFSPPELRSTFMRLQQLNVLQLENSRLRRERKQAWDALDAAEERTEWYRRQLRLESQLGLMLQAITTGEEQ